MPFRENLLKKIEIDRLAEKVTASMGPPDSGRRLDRELARRLMGVAGYERVTRRDLELYLIPGKPSPHVLVLDNDFPIYTTTPDDVVMRKSPLVKEMVKIRNIIKILNDGDVVASKKGDSVEKVRSDCVAALDLAYTVADIEKIEKQGTSALENSYGEGVIEALALFAELLNYASPPKVLQISHHTIIGKITEIPATDRSFGPLALYNRVNNSLKLVDREIRITDKERIQWVHSVAEDHEKASADGSDVFAFLKEAVLQRPYSPG